MAERGEPFEDGQSGNPAGRPKGARNKATLALEALLEGEAEKLTRKAIDMALDSDGPAMRLCLERLIPVRRDRLVQSSYPRSRPRPTCPGRPTPSLPPSRPAGDLTPSEAADVGRAVDAHVKAIEASDLHRRLTAIEEGMQPR